MKGFQLKPHPRSEIIQDEEEDEDKKRRMRMENNEKMVENSSSCLIAVVDDDLVVHQILSRLPVKSLMRFKCVCKAWKSIIEHDSHFIDLHYAHSQARFPRLLILPRFIYIDESSGYESSFFSAELQFDDDDDDSDGSRTIRGATICRFGRGRIKMSRQVWYSGPVRGLLCLADEEQDAVQIYNVSTGQAVTPWIRSAVAMTTKGNWRKKRCRFGFDPSTGKHKAIHIWEYPAVCEVLTVGVDARWRIIDDVLPCELRGDLSVYANGSIYWMITFTWDDRHGFSEFLVAFDIGSEKFRMIKIPKFTIWGDSPRPFLFERIVEMDGCVTVVRGRQAGKERHIVKMWKFHDCNKLQGINGTSSEQDWSEVTVRLPPCVSVDPHLSSLYPIPGKDMMILIACGNHKVKDGRIRPHPKFFSFYSYNMINKTFSKFEMHGISSIPGPVVSGNDYVFFTESLFSVSSVSGAELS